MHQAAVEFKPLDFSMLQNVVYRALLPVPVQAPANSDTRTNSEELHMSTTNTAFRAAAVLFCFGALTASAAVIVDTSDRGYYYATDFHDNTNKNYLTGQLTVNVGGTNIVNDYHSYFAFSALSGLGGPITGATLFLFNPAGGYTSPNSSETLVIDSVSGNIATLESGGTNSGEYNALAAGTSFGSAAVNAATDANFVAVTLNAAAIAFLNSSGSSPFAFGGYLSGTPFADQASHYEFGASAFTNAADGNTYLSLTIGTSASTPEPGTVGLMAIGLVAIAGIGRCARASSKLS
jgi:hypothetical protein